MFPLDKSMWATKVLKLRMALTATVTSLYLKYYWQKILLSATVECAIKGSTLNVCIYCSAFKSLAGPISFMANAIYKYKYISYKESKT